MLRVEIMLCTITHANTVSQSLTNQIPVPASPLVLIIAAPSEILRRASPRSLAPHTNGTLNLCLSTWFASSAAVNTTNDNKN